METIDNYSYMCKIFNLDSLLEIITKLINDLENRKFFLRQFDDCNEVFHDFRIWKKRVKWQDIQGNVLQSFSLGKYKLYNGSPENMEPKSIGLDEEITFSWLFSDLSELAKTITILREEKYNDENYSSQYSIMCSECRFEGLPYIESFIKYLVNYRIEHKIINITLEQMYECLNQFELTYNQSQKILHQKQPIE